MDKNQIELNIVEIVEIYNDAQNKINDLLKWVKEKCDEVLVLDEYLDTIGIEKNEQTRYSAFMSIAWLNENPLELVLEKGDFTEEQKRNIFDLSYKFVWEFHSKIQLAIITFIENKNLLTPFYVEVFKWVYRVWLAFNNLFTPWRNHIVNWVNKDLEERFSNDSNKIMNFLNENNLFDKGHNWENADRSYSALVEENGGYISKSYFEVFEAEVKAIVKELDIFISNLSKLEDELYNSKQNYIDYLMALKEALLETDVDKLIEKWSKVDEEWMSIKTPFQIVHPFEFYEDKYRKAVAPEWDLRILNTVFESDVEESMEDMYETFYDEIGRDNFRSSYEYSLANQRRVQLYLSSPVLYYSSLLVWLPSAQVVPNDDVVSKKFGKKIFAFPERVLKNKRSAPFMKLDSVIFEKEFIEKFRRSLFWRDEIFYKIYDIETIGHEYGHTLWLDSDSEVVMNKKSGVFKNIEEFKATAWWLVMYFTHPDLAPDLREELMLFHINRSISLSKYRTVNERQPYYCEWLIHLELLFESWIIIFNDGKKIELVFNDETFGKLKEVYIKHYKKLINVYLNKTDAWEFLNDYTIKNEEGFYLPKNDKVREFVEYYYSVYKEIGNEIDDSISKEQYM